MISLTKHNELKGYKSLEAYPEVAHFVTTRHEGISTGAYGSFNCSPYTNDSVSYTHLILRQILCFLRKERRASAVAD